VDPPSCHHYSNFSAVTRERGISLTSIAILNPLPTFVRQSPLMISTNQNATEIWDLYTMELLMTLKDYSEYAAAYAYAEENHHFAVTNGEKSIPVVWDPLTGRELFKLEGSRRISICSIVILHPTSANGVHYGSPLIILGANDSAFSIWNYQSQTILFSIEYENRLQMISLSCFQVPTNSKDPLDGVRVVTASYEKIIRWWHWGDNATKQFGNNQSNVPSCVVGKAVSNAGLSCPFVVSGDCDGQWTLWDISKDEALEILSIQEHKHRITGIEILENAAALGLPPLFITACMDYDTMVWNLLTGEKLRVFPGVSSISALRAFVTDTSVMVVTGDTAGYIDVWNVHQHDTFQQIDVGKLVRPIVFYEPRPHEKDLIKPSVIIGAATSCISIDIETGQETLQFTDDASTSFNAMITYSPPDTAQPPLLIACNEKGNIRTRNLLIHEDVCNFGVSEEEVLTMELFDPRKYHGPKAASIESAASLPPPSTKSTDAAASENVTADAHAATSTVDLSKPFLIAAGFGKDISLWDFEKGVLLQQWPHEQAKFITCMALHYPCALDSEDERDPKLATASGDGSAKLWNLRTMEILGVFGNTSRFDIFAISIYDPLAHFGRYGANRYGLTDIRSPRMVTSGKNGVSTVWNLKTQKVLHELRHATNDKRTITAQYIYVPPSPREDALLITVGTGTHVLIWNVISGELVRKLKGPKYIWMNAVNVYLPSHQRRQPVLYCGTTESIFCWKDALTTIPHMPLKEDVIKAYRSDLKKNPVDWSELKEMIATYGHALWMENSDLFQLAMKGPDNKFLVDFAAELTPLFPWMKRTKTVVVSKTTKQQRIEDGDLSLLQHAIQLNDSAWLRMLLSKIWLPYLSQDEVSNKLSNRLFSGREYFETSDLFLLTASYPKELLHFLSSLCLVRNAAALMTTPKEEHSNKLLVPFDCGLVGRGLLSKCTCFQLSANGLVTKMEDVTSTQGGSNGKKWWWLRWLGGARSGGVGGGVTTRKESEVVQVIPYVVPIKDLCQPAYLQTIFHLSNEYNTLKLFENEVVQAVIEFKWERFVKSFFLQDFALLLLLLVNFLIHAMFFDWYIRQPGGGHNNNNNNNAPVQQGCGVAMMVLNLVLCVYFLHHERLQLRQSKSLSAYYADGWNWLHLLTNSFVIATTVLQAIGFHPDASNTLHRNAAILAAATMPLLACEVLFYLSGLGSTGPLVRMIIKITQGTLTFMVILLVVLLTFAGSFVLLFEHLGELDVDFDGYSTYPRALMTVYGFLYGSYSLSELAQAKSPTLAFILLSAFLFFIVIILLNLLIAIMGDKYDEVQANATAELNYGLAKLILEYETIIGQATIEKHQATWYPKWIMVLKVDSMDGDVTEENWQGRLHAIKQLIQSTADENTATINRLSSRFTASESEQQARIAAMEQQLQVLNENILKLLAAKGGSN
jgi:WD40 repeat protein